MKNKIVLSVIIAFSLIVTTFTVTAYADTPATLEGINASSNYTLTNFTSLDTNSTLTNSTALDTNFTFTNSTALDTNSTLTNSTALDTNFTLTNSISGTSSYQDNTSNENPILNASQSIEHNSLKNSNSQVIAKVIKNTNKKSITITGSEFLKVNIDSIENLSKLTLSAWVMPDYSQGSPQFTVISKENSFILAINNNIPPSRVVVFSIFDGIKWNSINSTMKIPEEWTQIVATFNGTHMNVYVNGHKESTSEISDETSISVNGKQETNNIDNISSGTDIVIGAYANSLRGTTYNFLSGSLEDVKIYNSLLSDSQISDLYHTNIHSNIQTTTIHS